MSRTMKTDPAWVRAYRFRGDQPDKYSDVPTWDILRENAWSAFPWPNNGRRSRRWEKKNFRGSARAIERAAISNWDFDIIPQQRTSWWD